MDAGVAAGMVVEENFFPIARADFAIGRQAHGGGGEAMRFARGVETKDIGLGFGLPYHRIQQRRHQEQKHRENRADQGQGGGIGAVFQPQALPEARQRPIQQVMGEPESQADDEGEVHRQPQAVMEGVVAHFVAHDGLDLGQRSLVQQIVVEADLGGAGETGNIGADAGGLPRGIEINHALGGDLIGPRQRQHRCAYRAIWHRLVIIEQRRNKHRRDHAEQQGEDEGTGTCP